MYIYALPTSTPQGLSPCLAPISLDNPNEKEHHKRAKESKHALHVTLLSVLPLYAPPASSSSITAAAAARACWWCCLGAGSLGAWPRLPHQLHHLLFIATGLLWPALHTQALQFRPLQPHAFLPLIFSLPPDIPLIHANAPVHNSCAPAVSSQPNCESAAIFLWPANRPFVGCLLCLGAQPVPLLLAGSGSRPPAWAPPRLVFWDSPSEATDAGAGTAAAAAAAAAEAA